MKNYKVGILGATGAVGREMMKVLLEKNFPIEELRVFASARSVGKVLEFGNKEVVCQLPCKENFEGLDIVLGAAKNDIAKQYKDDIVAAGALFIDNSSAFRMDPSVPLVVAGINDEDVFKHQGVIANPNCSTIITLTAVNGINKLSKIKHMVVSTYQAASGAGAEGPVELRNEEEAIFNGNEVTPKVFQYQLAENLIPQIGGFLDNGYTAEEMKMQNEGRRIFHNNELLVNCTCVRVPVIRSHSISVTLVTENKVSLDEARTAISADPFCKLYDDPSNKIYPMPILTSDQDLVFVGRIRKDLINENGITLWCSGDQVRKGAATNAIDIAISYIRGE